MNTSNFLFKPHHLTRQRQNNHRPAQTSVHLRKKDSKRKTKSWLQEGIVISNWQVQMK